MEGIRDAVRQYIQQEFLAADDPTVLKNTTPLVSSGILDSIATMKLVSFLEERFNIELQPHEVDTDNLDTLDSIATLVQSKL